MWLGVHVTRDSWLVWQHDGAIPNMWRCDLTETCQTCDLEEGNVTGRNQSNEINELMYDDHFPSCFSKDGNYFVQRLHTSHILDIFMADGQTWLFVMSFLTFHWLLLAVLFVKVTFLLLSQTFIAPSQLVSRCTSSCFVDLFHIFI